MSKTDKNSCPRGMTSYGEDRQDKYGIYTVCWIVLSAKENVKEEEKARKCWSAGRKGLAKKVTFKYTLRRGAFQAEETANASQLSELGVVCSRHSEVGPFQPSLPASWALCLHCRQEARLPGAVMPAGSRLAGPASLCLPAAPPLLYPCPAFIPLFSSVAAFCLAGCVLRVASCHFSTCPFLGSPSQVSLSPFLSLCFPVCGGLLISVSGTSPLHFFFSVFRISSVSGPLSWSLPSLCQSLFLRSLFLSVSVLACISVSLSRSLHPPLSL